MLCPVLALGLLLLIGLKPLVRMPPGAPQRGEPAGVHVDRFGVNARGLKQRKRLLEMGADEVRHVRDVGVVVGGRQQVALRLGEHGEELHQQAEAVVAA